MKTKISFIICFSLIYIGLSSWTWPLSNSNDPNGADTFVLAFGPRNLNDTGGFTYNYHRGVDIVANVGTEVYSAHPGLVTQYPDSDGNGIGFF